MNKDEILNAFGVLDGILHERGVKGEICLYGGAVMCLAYSARASTKDVDAVFLPSSEIRAAAAETAERLDLPEDWLNDGVKGFVVEHPRRIFKTLPNLSVFVAAPEYLFAMKAMAARIDTADRDDVRFLLREIGIVHLEDALKMIEKYYPASIVKAATRFFLEEVLDESGDGRRD